MVDIRRESPADGPAIEAVIAEAFRNAIHTSHTEHLIVNELRRAGLLTASLVADADAGLVGHVAVSPVSVSDGTLNWFGLGPLAVLSRYQHRGIGSRLMDKALRTLREQGAGGCVVVGEPAYYGRFGFRADPNLVLPGVPPEYFQAIVLDGSAACGIVAYHAAFSGPP